MSEGTKKRGKTKFYGEFFKFQKCSLTEFEPQTPTSHNYLNFDMRKSRSRTRSGGREANETPSRDSISGLKINSWMTWLQVMVFFLFNNLH